MVLQELGYPELAVMDAHKAVLRQFPHYSILSEVPVVDTTSTKEIPDMATRTSLFQQLVCARRAAKAFNNAIYICNMAVEQYCDNTQLLAWFTGSKKELQDVILAIRADRGDPRFGCVRARAYPWMDSNVLCRQQELIDMLKKKMETASDGRCTTRESGMVLPSQEPLPRKDVSLGVFALRDIVKGEEILENPSYTGRENRQVARHLDTLGLTTQPDRQNAEELLDILVKIIDTGSQAHPLSSTPAISLTANYVGTAHQAFELKNNSTIPLRLLWAVGINPYTNPTYDGWVLQTLRYRVVNNVWAVDEPTNKLPVRYAVARLLTHINHSCAPKCAFACPGNLSAILRATKNIQAGQEISLSYIGHIADGDLQHKRAKLRKWFGGDCQCEECRWEEEALSI